MIWLKITSYINLCLMMGKKKKKALRDPSSLTLDKHSKFFFQTYYAPISSQKINK